MIKSYIAKHKKSAAFSLVELLTAMTILVIIVLLMVTIFKDADRIWFTGSGRALSSTAGRAALNLISHDLQYAVADNILTFTARPDRYGINSYGFANDEICFVSLEQNPNPTNGLRTAREVHYWVRASTTRTGTYELVRGYYSSEIVNSPGSHCYFNRLWYAGSRPSANAVVAEDVAGLDFVAVTTNLAGAEVDVPLYNSALLGDQLPEYVDVYLELLSEVDADRATSLAYDVAEQRRFVEQKHRRFVTRVYFNNKYGYKQR